MMMMTFDVDYGPIPNRLLKFYRQYGVTPYQHERLVNLFGDDWPALFSFAKERVDDQGIFRLSKFI